MKKDKFGRIGVLMGGPSSERDISFKSGKAVYQALKSQGLNVIPIDIRSNSLKQVKQAKISLAFIALHGKFGEDGTVQSMLEAMRIPYTGSGIIASYLCLDKVASRRIFKHHNIPVPEFQIFYPRIKSCMPKLNITVPIVLKPSSQGSSIGVTFVARRCQFKSSLTNAFKYDDTVIAEEYLPGREITVGILEDKPLPIVEIVPKKKFFDFQAKYEKGKSEYIVPARLSQRQYSRAQEIGLMAHRLLGCRGFSRVDMILHKDTPFVLEVNSIPGLTSTSLLPMAAEAKGISFGQLCLRIVKSAMQK
ncbi:MAG: D-alanine--D-alanine ligase [Candidatus Omnitrophica bacterium]|nr:D-alanine--D-alanine ligase [Candidatus Omnitrophota bacterium]